MSRVFEALTKANHEREQQFEKVSEEPGPDLDDSIPV